MRKQKVILNKFERMLLESKFPTLRILLEEEEEKKDEGGGEEKKDDGGLDNLFGDSSDSGGDEGEKKEEGGDDGGLDNLFGGSEEEDSEGGEDEAATEDDAGTETAGKDDASSKQAQKEKEEKAIKVAAEKSANIYKNVVGDAIQPGTDDFNKALFGSRSFEMKNENTKIKKQQKRLYENISKYLFRNVNMKSLSRRSNLSINSNFRMSEKNIFKLNKVINEATSVDEIINDKFWEENATVDLIVDNAINLTKNFQDLIDIPKLIMNSVAIKFGKQAAQESGENKNAENEYKLKLDEFLQKYATSLKQLPDYENYDTSRTVFNASRPDIAATGAFSPGG